MSTLQMRVIALLMLGVVLIVGGFVFLFPVIPAWLYILAALLLFSGGIVLFEKSLWSLPVFRSIGLVECPDISGHWVGQLTTSYDEQSKITKVSVEIKQSWTQLVVHFFAPNSQSVSLSANLFKDDSTDDYVLTYIYNTQPHEHGHETDPPHIGLSVLRLNELHELSGYYHYYYQDGMKAAFVRGQLVLTRSADVASQAIAP